MTQWDVINTETARIESDLEKNRESFDPNAVAF